eukprot:PhF_6_TR16429/c0_g1_i1/m.25209
MSSKTVATTSAGDLPVPVAKSTVSFLYPNKSIGQCLAVLFQFQPQTISAYLCYVGILLYLGLFLSVASLPSNMRYFLPWFHFVLCTGMMVISQAATLFGTLLSSHVSATVRKDAARVLAYANILHGTGLGMLFVVLDMTMFTGWIEFIPKKSWQYDLQLLFALVVIVFLLATFSIASKAGPLVVHWWIWGSYAMYMAHSPVPRHTPRNLLGFGIMFASLFIGSVGIPEVIFSSTSPVVGAKKFITFFGNSGQISHLTMIVGVYLTFS